MGFFKNMFNEAGKKTGSAIGNRLFPKYTDYVRIGELGVDPQERFSKEIMLAEERMELEHNSNIMQSLLELKFDGNNLEHNIGVLTQIAAIIDSLPSLYIRRTEPEDKVYKMAKSMMNSGVTICKAIDPHNSVIEFFENKYNK